ncbi:glycosyltransferase [gamma proteobacterium NOR5-3]|nr:glycosyltransferase [gamma proteobacterium NOR5-3]
MAFFGYKRRAALRLSTLKQFSCIESIKVVSVFCGISVGASILDSRLIPEKILFVSHGAEFGGGERSLQLLIEGLRGQKSPPLIALVVPAKGALSSWAESEGITTFVHNISESKAQDYLTLITCFFWWFAILAMFRPTVIHANDPSASRLLILPSRTLGIPMVCHFRFIQSQEYYRWVFKRLPLPNFFVTVSFDSRDKLEVLFTKRMRTIDLEVVHNAVDMGKFEPDLKAPDGARNFNVGIVANLQKVKGHEDFLKMAQLLLESNEPYAFHVVGTDLQRQGRLSKLQKMTKELEISNHVTFHGAVENVADAIKMLDIVVCPSHEEPFGRTVIEAMSSGKPVVAYAVGGIVEIISSGYDGILVDHGSISTLATSVSSLCHDKTEYLKVAERGHLKVAAEFSASTYVAKMTDIFNRAIREK